MTEDECAVVERMLSRADLTIKDVIRTCLKRRGVCEGCLFFFCDTDENSKFSCAFSSHSWSEKKREKYAARLEKARREAGGGAAVSDAIKAASKED